MFKIEKPHRFTIILPRETVDSINDLAKSRCVSTASWIRTVIFAEIEKQRHQED